MRSYNLFHWVERSTLYMVQEPALLSATCEEITLKISFIEFRNPTTYIKRNVEMALHNDNVAPERFATNQCSGATRRRARARHAYDIDGLDIGASTHTLPESICKISDTGPRSCQRRSAAGNMVFCLKSIAASFSLNLRLCLFPITASFFVRPSSALSSLPKTSSSPLPNVIFT
jgi:hypothetical protein